MDSVEIGHASELPEQYFDSLWKAHAEKLKKIVLTELKTPDLINNICTRVRTKLAKELGFRTNATDIEAAAPWIINAAEESCRDQTPAEWGQLKDWEKAKRGDEAAFSELERRHQRDVMRWLERSGVYQYQDRQDLSQNVWLQVFKYLKQVRGPELRSYLGWLKAIATHEGYSFVEKERNSIAQLLPSKHIAIDEEACENMSIMLDMAANDESLRRHRESLEATENKIVLEKLKKDLDPRERRIIELECEGYRQNDIAEELKVTQGTISTLRRRVIVRLRMILKASKGGQ